MSKMSGWNNRIVKLRDDTYTFGYRYGLHEVFYDENGKPTSCTENSMIGYFESPDELIASVNLMKNDIDKHKDILDMDEDF